MKKYFDVIEVVKYQHRIELDIDESMEDIYEDLADQVADYMLHGVYETKEDILSEFVSEFGEAVTFIEDGSPDGSFDIC